VCNYPHSSRVLQQRAGGTRQRSSAAYFCLKRARLITGAADKGHCTPVYANHAGNVVTRRSHSGIIIFVNNAPIIWFSKRQNTVESSTFGSELVAMRICRDLIVSLRYKLRMFGLNLQGPAYTFCDNAGVVKNVSIPESVLHKRHNAINYHIIRESVAAEIMQVGKEDTKTNLSDLFTKVQDGNRRNFLCQFLFK
jgi:hypothetical protein